MFRTPTKMVNTRSSTKKQNEENQRELKAEGQQQQQQPKQELSSFTLSHLEDLPTTSQDQTKKTFDKTIILDVGSVNGKKSNDNLTHEPDQKDKLKSLKSLKSSTHKSNVSKSTSILARKKKLEFEAAEAKARIQMELIDKKLAADLEELEDKYSSQSEKSEIHTQKEVDKEIEKWIDRSQLELEQQPVPPTGTHLDRPHPPPPPPPPPPPAPGAGTNDTVHLLAAALKDLAATSTAEGPNARMLSRLCTPRDLPNFSGDPMEWLTFKQAYDESTQVCNFNEKENLWRLRKCLHGPAKEAVTALLIGATSPGIVMSTLELQFGNPDIIISKIVQSVNKLQVLSQEYHKEIVPFSIKVKNYVAAVSAIGNKEYLQGANVVTMILAKLPTVLISKWIDYSYPFINEGIKPRLVILSEFLENEAIKTSKTAVSLCNAYSDNFARRKQSDLVPYRSQTILVQNELSEDKCRFCRVSKHTLTDCKKFKKSLRKDRWQFIKRSGLCYKCIISRHNKETCPAPVCDIDSCGQSHHRLLHYNTNMNNSNRTASVNITEITEPCNSLLYRVRIYFK